jgi:hypothetical protein
MTLPTEHFKPSIVLKIQRFLAEDPAEMSGVWPAVVQILQDLPAHCDLIRDTPEMR